MIRIIAGKQQSIRFIPSCTQKPDFWLAEAHQSEKKTGTRWTKSIVCCQTKNLAKSELEATKEDKKMNENQAA